MLINRILCVTDLSSVSQNAERAAINLAIHLQSKLVVLSCGDFFSHDLAVNYLSSDIIQPPQESPYMDDYLKIIEQRRIETIAHFEKNFENSKLEKIKHIEYQVKLDNEIIAAIDLIENSKTSFDLIVVGKHKVNFFEKLIFGDPAKEISEESHTSTLLMPDGDNWKEWNPTSVLVGTSLNGMSEYAESIAMELAILHSVPISFIHVIDVGDLNFELNIPNIFPIDYIPSQMETTNFEDLKSERYFLLKQIKDTASTKYTIDKINTYLEFGRVGDVILKQIQENKINNLIVIGSSGKTALKKFFLGSKTDIIEESCQIPILIAQRRI